MLGPPGPGRVLGGGVQVAALGLQPGGRVLQRGQVGGASWRVPGQAAAMRDRPGDDVLASGQDGVEVVVQQAIGRGVGFRDVVVGSEDTGVLAEQVVQLVAAGLRLGEQMLVIELIEMRRAIVRLVSSRAAAA